MNLSKYFSSLSSQTMRISALSALSTLFLLTTACKTDDDPAMDDGDDSASGEESSDGSDSDAEQSDAEQSDSDTEPSDTQEEDDSTGDEEAETGEEGEEEGECDPLDDTVDESECTPQESDYQPENTQDDPYAACVSDGGVYELFADPPSSIGRVEVFDSIAEMLWLGDAAPDAAAFTAAFELYNTPDGLGSRVGRREDHHYPPVAEEDRVEGVDRDKQCSEDEIVPKYPDRCAGPAKIEPLIVDAFGDGIEEKGSPEVAAAKIRAAGLWFLYLSTYKEAFTCSFKGKDCDSSWAYFTGGVQSDGNPLGFARNVKAYSEDTFQRIFDGVLAVRCWRDLYSIEEYPELESFEGGAEGLTLFNNAWEQLDNALHRGYALIVRQELLGETNGTCDEPSEAAEAFFKVAAPVLVREAKERDETVGAEFEAIWEKDSLEQADFARAVEIIDELFPCS